MLIDEMHILIDERVQKLNSYANDNILPEQKDLHLNTFIRKYVDNIAGNLRRIESPADFQHNQRLLDSLGEVYVRNTNVPIYNDSELDVVFGILPSNYRHLISDVSSVTYNYYGVAKEVENISLFTTTFSFLAEVTNIKALEIKTIRNGVPTTIFKLSDHFGYSSGIDDSDAFYQIANLIKENVKDVYWENFGGTFYKNRFILPSNVAQTIQVVITHVVEGVDTILTLTNQSVEHKYVRTIHGANDYVKKQNRLQKGINLQFVRDNPYEKTTWESPISTIANGKIYVYEDFTFKVKTLEINYVKNPAQVSKQLGIHCDLHEDAQQIVLENTIAHIEGIISSANYQKTVQENQLNNN